MATKTDADASLLKRHKNLLNFHDTSVCMIDKIIVKLIKINNVKGTVKPIQYKKIKGQSGF